MKPKEKLEICESLYLRCGDDDDLDDVLNGTLEEITLNLKQINDSLRSKYESSNFTRIRFQLVNGYESDAYFDYYGYRLETDKEFQKRIQREEAVEKKNKENQEKARINREKQKTERESKEYQTYLALKKKFEGE